jgi:hypothetical protein
MCHGRSREEKEEVTNPLLSFHRAVWRKINETVNDMKKQAPAARMVGEFAVKHVANEANKNIRKVTDPSPPVSE